MSRVVRAYGEVPLPAIPGYVTEQQCDDRASTAAGSVASGARMLLLGTAVVAAVVGFLVGKSRR